MKYLVDANVLSEPTKPSPNLRVVDWLRAHEPDIAVDDGRDSANRLREANLDHHLLDGKVVPGPAAADTEEAAKLKQKDTALKATEKPVAKVAAEALAPPLDFGSADDFQLKQALNQLKGQPVTASVKAVAAQAKPQ